MRQVAGITAFAALASGASRDAWAGSRERALRLFDRLAGVPLLSSDPRLAQMTALIDAGDLQGAAEIAASDDGFYNITLKHFFTPMSNREGDVLAPLNDFVATGIGIARDDLDARALLTSDNIYKANASVNDPGAATDATKDIQTDEAVYGSNKHYDYLEKSQANLRAVLVPARQKAYASAAGGTPATDLNDAAGLITTRAWGSAHLIAGTNRRAIEYTFREFMCTPISGWADPSLRDFRVRRDVDRRPGGNAQTFLTNCRSCHAGMDAMGGAYAYFDWKQDGGTSRVLYKPGTVANKFNQNNGVYPDGFITGDDSWLNLSTVNGNAAFGWVGETSGNGIKQLGAMIANSQGFAACIAQKAFTEVCRRKPSENEAAAVVALAQDFQVGGYKLKRLFKRAATLSNCLPQ